MLRVSASTPPTTPCSVRASRIGCVWCVVDDGGPAFIPKVIHQTCLHLFRSIVQRRLAWPHTRPASTQSLARILQTRRPKQAARRAPSPAAALCRPTGSNIISRVFLTVVLVCYVVLLAGTRWRRALRRPTGSRIRSQDLLDSPNPAGGSSPK